MTSKWNQDESHLNEIKCCHIQGIKKKDLFGGKTVAIMKDRRSSLFFLLYRGQSQDYWRKKSSRCFTDCNMWHKRRFMSLTSPSTYLGFLSSTLLRCKLEPSITWNTHYPQINVWTLPKLPIHDLTEFDKLY